jgi:hypothetical protein
MGNLAERVSKAFSSGVSRMQYAHAMPAPVAMALFGALLMSRLLEVQKPLRPFLADANSFPHASSNDYSARHHFAGDYVSISTVGLGVPDTQA